MAAFGADRDRDKEKDKNKGEQVSRMKTGYLPRLVWIIGQGPTFKQEFWSPRSEGYTGQICSKIGRARSFETAHVGREATLEEGGTRGKRKINSYHRMQELEMDMTRRF